jgi:hypothetical protein
VNIPPNEHGWALAEAIERRLGHGPRRMRSCQSYGPIKAWCCDSCRIMAHSTGTLAPICEGSGKSYIGEGM